MKNNNNWFVNIFTSIEAKISPEKQLAAQFLACRFNIEHKETSRYQSGH